ncbi:hypothetical protein OAM01_01415 [bacterium]|nr:hypothetical protein [bacterium]
MAKLLNYEPKRQLLHASKLSFEHPVTKKPLEFTAPLPTDFQQALKHLAEVSDVDLVDI